MPTDVRGSLTEKTDADLLTGNNIELQVPASVPHDIVHNGVHNGVSPSLDSHSSLDASGHSSIDTHMPAHLSHSSIEIQPSRSLGPVPQARAPRPASVRFAPSTAESPRTKHGGHAHTQSAPGSRRGSAHTQGHARAHSKGHTRSQSRGGSGEDEEQGSSSEEVDELGTERPQREASTASSLWQRLREKSIDQSGKSGIWQELREKSVA